VAVKTFDAPLSETPIRIRLLLETTADMLPFVLRGLDSVEAKVSVESIMYLSSTDPIEPLPSFGQQESRKG
jgi:hypothetical protein